MCCNLTSKVLLKLFIDLLSVLLTHQYHENAKKREETSYLCDSLEKRLRCNRIHIKGSLIGIRFELVYHTVIASYVTFTFFKFE